MFEVLGLSEQAELVYRTLAGSRPASADELTVKLRTDRPLLVAALDELESHGLVVPLPCPKARYAAVAPQTALEVLFLRKEEQLKLARIEAESLAAEFRSAAGQYLAEPVEVLYSRGAVLRQLDRMQRSARHTYLSLDRPPYLQDPETCTPVNDRLLDSRVTVRAIYDRSALDRPGRLEQVEHAVRRGEVARVLPRVPVKLLVVDECVALLPLQTMTGTLDAALVVHPSTLLQALVALFEALWSQAMPLHVPSEPTGAVSVRGTTGADGTGAATLTAEARRILALLTAGLPDDAIARQLEMSPKTVQRRIRDLMARLGAATRFQAGLSAAFRGWVQAPGGTPLVPAADRPPAERLAERVAERVADDAGLARTGMRHGRRPNPATRSNRCFELESTE